tara:strand:- start:63 stop:455 length:393 start_codon:yes stop_codon:yes gene_type:complete
MENKKENRGGSRIHNAGYRKVRVEMFAMVEQLICSNAILTASLQHNELLQRKAHLTRNALREEISDTRAKVEELKFDYDEFEKTKYNLGLLEERMMSITSCEEQLEFLKAEKLDEAKAIKKNRDFKKVVN